MACLYGGCAALAAIVAFSGGCGSKSKDDVVQKAPDPPPPLTPTRPRKTAKSKTSKSKPSGLPVEARKPLIEDAPAPPLPGMAWIRGGSFTMGDRRGAPDKNPQYRELIPEHQDALYEHPVELDGFWMDKTEVTNRQFKAFVDATAYVTSVEKELDVQKLYAQKGKPLPKGKKRKLPACSICFNSKMDPTKVDKSGQLDANWIYKSKIWTMVDGADWRHPEGKDSSIEKRMNHPVVHVSYGDAVQYCKWAGKQLPTEAQWEYAARGGLKGKKYPWGDELKPGGKWQANIWQGKFPHKNTAEDGYLFAAPVARFPPNGYGLYDMSGNLWEWCADWYRADYYVNSPQYNPKGPDSSFDPNPNEQHIPKRVQRGGSFMCSDNYCIGYGVAARMKAEPEYGTFHAGFRCVVNARRLDEYRNAPARKAKKSQK